MNVIHFQHLVPLMVGRYDRVHHSKGGYERTVLKQARAREAQQKTFRLDDGESVRLIVGVADAGPEARFVLVGNVGEKDS